MLGRVVDREPPPEASAALASKVVGQGLLAVNVEIVADFARFRSPVSLEADHPFRSKPITRFARSRSLVSLEADQSF